MWDGGGRETSVYIYFYIWVVRVVKAHVVSALCACLMGSVYCVVCKSCDCFECC